MFYAVYFIIGAFSGALAGLLGLGGGIIVVPALAATFSYYNLIPPEQNMQMAIGTSLSTIVITFLASLFAHIKRKSVRWGFVAWLLPSLIAGVILGAFVARYLPSHYLRIFFCIFLLVIACQLLFSKKNEEKISPVPSRLLSVIATIIIGVLASVLGIGGGILLMPFLLRCQLNMREATGTSVACGIGIGVAASFSYMFFGSSAVDLPWSTGYIYWPAFLGVATSSVIFAPLGTMLAYRLPALLLKRFLAVFLIIVAVDMLFFP